MVKKRDTEIKNKLTAIDNLKADLYKALDEKVQKDKGINDF